MVHMDKKNTKHVLFLLFTCQIDSIFNNIIIFISYFIPNLDFIHATAYAEMFSDRQSSNFDIWNWSYF